MKVLGYDEKSREYAGIMFNQDDEEDFVEFLDAVENDEFNKDVDFQKHVDRTIEMFTKCKEDMLRCAQWKRDNRYPSMVESETINVCLKAVRTVHQMEDNPWVEKIRNILK